jgi:ribosomal protein S18 acetylase RimI-like enzyme
MSEQITISRAVKGDAVAVSVLVGELLHEIMHRVGVAAFNFDLARTTSRLEDFIEKEKNFVFVAKDGDAVVGFVTVYECFALYAEGAFGTMAELYVAPAYRSQGIGKNLVENVKAFGKTRDWSRLEVTTPPLPQFDKALAFYERDGFEVTGGRKMKSVLD